MNLLNCRVNKLRKCDDAANLHRLYAFCHSIITWVNRILRRAEKPFDPQMLLDPLGEQEKEP
jgi:hypothetical protein